jgi:hypothetical protein
VAVHEYSPPAAKRCGLRMGARRYRYRRPGRERRGTALRGSTADRRRRRVPATAKHACRSCAARASPSTASPSSMCSRTRSRSSRAASDSASRTARSAVLGPVVADQHRPRCRANAASGGHDHNRTRRLGCQRSQDAAADTRARERRDEVLDLRACTVLRDPILDRVERAARVCPQGSSNGAVEPRRTGIITRVSGVRAPPPASEAPANGRFTG